MSKLFAAQKVRVEDEDSARARSPGRMMYRNAAYEPQAEIEEDGDADERVASPSQGGVRPSSPSESHKMNNFVGKDDASMDAGPSSRGADMSMPMSARGDPPLSSRLSEVRMEGGASSSGWVNNEVPSPATKRAGSQQGGLSTPKGPSILSPTAVKRAKNTTMVHEMCTLENENEEVADGEASNSVSEEGEGVVPVARHVIRGPAVGCWTSNAVALWEAEVKRLMAAGRHEDALRWTAPPDGMIRCTVRRMKNFLGHTTAYHLFLDTGDAFVLAARKRKKSKASNFVLSISQDDLAKDSDLCIGKLRANFVGTEYSLVGRTGSISSASAEDLGSPALRTAPASPLTPNIGRLGPPSEPFSRDELAVHYKQTALTAKGGPRVMLVATPLPECDWVPAAADDTLTNCLEAARRRELPTRVERQLCMLATRQPEWDAALKAYTLDFHGRVRAASVKNFQLVHWDHNTDRRGSDLVLQFGKIDEGSDDFALDFTFPLSLQKAFAVALASIDSKLCYAM